MSRWFAAATSSLVVALVAVALTAVPARAEDFWFGGTVIVTGTNQPNISISDNVYFYDIEHVTVSNITARTIILVNYSSTVNVSMSMVTASSTLQIAPVGGNARLHFDWSNITSVPTTSISGTAWLGFTYCRIGRSSVDPTAISLWANDTAALVIDKSWISMAWVTTSSKFAVDWYATSGHPTIAIKDSHWSMVSTGSSNQGYFVRMRANQAATSAWFTGNTIALGAVYDVTVINMNEATTYPTNIWFASNNVTLASTDGDCRVMFGNTYNGVRSFTNNNITFRGSSSTSSSDKTSLITSTVSSNLQGNLFADGNRISSDFAKFIAFDLTSIPSTMTRFNVSVSRNVFAVPAGRGFSTGVEWGGASLLQQSTVHVDDNEVRPIDPASIPSSGMMATLLVLPDSVGLHTTVTVSRNKVWALGTTQLVSEASDARYTDTIGEGSSVSVCDNWVQGYTSQSSQYLFRFYYTSPVNGALLNVSGNSYVPASDAGLPDSHGFVFMYLPMNARNGSKVIANGNFMNVTTTYASGISARFLSMISSSSTSVFSSLPNAHFEVTGNTVIINAPTATSGTVAGISLVTGAYHCAVSITRNWIWLNTSASAGEGILASDANSGTSDANVFSDNWVHVASEQSSVVYALRLYKMYSSRSTSAGLVVARNTLHTARASTVLTEQHESLAVAIVPTALPSVNITDNVVSNSFYADTMYRPDGFQLASSGDLVRATDLLVTGNTLSANFTNGTPDYLTTGFSFLYPGTSYASSSKAIFSRNVVNAMLFANSSALRNPYAAASTCDYLNGQRVTEIIRSSGTVNSCSSPISSFPPLPAGPAVVPTPVPAWIPTPVPTPAPPQASTYSGTATVEGAVSQSGFTNTTVAIKDPTTVVLADCTIGTLHIYGTMADVDITVRNCTIQYYVYLYSDITGTSKVTFEGGAIGTVTSGSGSVMQIYGRVADTSVLTLQDLTLTVRQGSSSYNYGIDMKNFVVGSGAKLLVQNVHFYGRTTSTSGDYSGLLRLHGVVEGGVVDINGCWMDMEMGERVYLFVIKSPLSNGGRFLLRNNNMSLHSREDFFYVVYFDNTALGSGHLIVDNNTLAFTVFSTSTYNSRCALLWFNTNNIDGLPGSVVNITRNTVVSTEHQYFYAGYLLPNFVAEVHVSSNNFTFGSRVRYPYIAHPSGRTIVPQPASRLSVDGNTINCYSTSYGLYALRLQTRLGAGSHVSTSSNVMNQCRFAGNGILEVQPYTRSFRSGSSTYSYNFLSEGTVTIDVNDNVMEGFHPAYRFIYMSNSYMLGDHSILSVRRNRMTQSTELSCTNTVVLPELINGSKAMFTDNTIAVVCSNSYSVNVVAAGGTTGLVSSAIGSLAAFNVSGNNITATNARHTSSAASGLTIYSIYSAVELRGNTVRLVGSTSSATTVYVRPPNTAVASSAAAAVVADGNDIGYTSVNGASFDCVLLRFDSTSHQNITVTNNKLMYTGAGRNATIPTASNGQGGMLNLEPGPAQTIINGNTFTVKLTTTAVYHPDAVQLYWRSYYSNGRMLIAENNVATFTDSTGAPSAFTVFLNADPSERYFDSNVRMSGNVVNAMRLFNTTETSLVGRTITSQCDYLNGQAVTALMNGTVLTCSAPAPPLPPFPTGAAAVVPTPVPAWIPTPVPTPAPPTLAPNAVSADVTGSITATGTTSSTYRIDSPVTVALTDCAFTVLWITGTILPTTTMTFTNCNIRHVYLNADLVPGAGLTFSRGLIGYTSTLYSNVAAFTAYGQIQGALRFEHVAITRYVSSSSYCAKGVDFLNRIAGSSATVTFTNVTAYVQGTNYDLCGFARFHDVIDGATVLVDQSHITTRNNDQPIGFYFTSVIRDSSFILRNSQVLTVAYTSTSAYDIYLPPPGTGTRGGATVTSEGNNVTWRGTSSSTWNVQSQHVDSVGGSSSLSESFTVIIRNNNFTVDSSTNRILNLAGMHGATLLVEGNSVYTGFGGGDAMSSGSATTMLASVSGAMTSVSIPASLTIRGNKVWATRVTTLQVGALSLQQSLRSTTLVVENNMIWAKTQSTPLFVSLATTDNATWTVSGNVYDVSTTSACSVMNLGNIYSSNVVVASNRFTCTTTGGTTSRMIQLNIVTLNSTVMLSLNTITSTASYFSTARYISAGVEVVNTATNVAGTYDRNMLSLDSNVISVSVNGTSVAYGFRRSFNFYLNVSLNNNTITATGAEGTQALQMDVCTQTSSVRDVMTTVTSNTIATHAIRDGSYDFTATTTAAAFTASYSSLYRCALTVTDNTFVLRTITPPADAQRRIGGIVQFDPDVFTLVFQRNTLKAEMTDYVSTGYMPDGLEFTNPVRLSTAVYTITGNTMSASEYPSGTSLFLTTGVSLDQGTTSMVGTILSSGNAINAMLFFNTSIALGYTNQMQATSQCDYLNGQRVTTMANFTVLSCSAPAPPLPSLPSGSAMVPTPVPAWVPTPQPTPAPPTLAPAAPSGSYMGVVNFTGSLSNLLITDPTNVVLRAPCTVTTLTIQGTIADATIDISGCTIQRITVNGHLVRTSFTVRDMTLGSSSSSYPYGAVFLGLVDIGSAVEFRNVYFRARTRYYSSYPGFGTHSQAAVNLAMGLDKGATVTVRDSRGSLSNTDYNIDESSVVRARQVLGNAVITLTNTTMAVSAYKGVAAVWVEHPEMVGKVEISNCDLTMSSTSSYSNSVAYVFNASATIVDSGSFVNVTNNTVSLQTWSTRESAIAKVWGVDGASSWIRVAQNRLTWSSRSTARAIDARYVTDGASLQLEFNSLKLYSSQSFYSTYVWAPNKAVVVVNNNTYWPYSTSYTISNAYFFGNAQLAQNGTAITITNNWLDMRVTGYTFLQLSQAQVYLPSPASGWVYVALDSSSLTVTNNYIRNTYTSISGAFFYLPPAANSSTVACNDNTLLIPSNGNVGMLLSVSELATGGGTTVSVMRNTLVHITGQPSSMAIGFSSVRSGAWMLDHGAGAGIMITHNVINVTKTSSSTGSIGAVGTGTVGTALLQFSTNKVTVVSAGPVTRAVMLPQMYSQAKGASVVVDSNTIDVVVAADNSYPSRGAGVALGLPAYAPLGPASGYNYSLAVTNNVFRTARPISTVPNEGVLFAVVNIPTQYLNTLTFSSNTLTNMEQTVSTPYAKFQPDALSLGTTTSTVRAYSVISDNVMTSTTSSGTPLAFTTAVNTLYSSDYQSYMMSGNVANAMLFYNTTSMLSPSRLTAVSTCDYLNGQRVTAINNGTVRSCSAPAPSMPPLPTGSALVVPTPAPAWVPTPVPTPAPPTLLPSVPSVDVSGAVSSSGFTDATYVVNNPTTVRLSDCSITSALYLTGTIANADIEVRNCTIRTIYINGHVTSSSVVKFINDTIGVGSSYGAVFVYGSVDSNSQLHFETSSLTTSYGNTRNVVVAKFLNSVASGATVRFFKSNITATVTSTSADYGGLVLIHGMSGGTFEFEQCRLVMNGREYMRMIQVVSSISSGATLRVSNSYVYFVGYRRTANAIEVPTLTSGSTLAVVNCDITMQFTYSSTSSSYTNMNFIYVTSGSASRIDVNGSTWDVQGYRSYLVNYPGLTTNAALNFNDNTVFLRSRGRYLYVTNRIAGSSRLLNSLVSMSGNTINTNASIYTPDVYGMTSVYFSGCSVWMNNNVIETTGRLQLLYMSYTSISYIYASLDNTKLWFTGNTFKRVTTSSSSTQNLYGNVFFMYGMRQGSSVWFNNNKLDMQRVRTSSTLALFYATMDIVDGSALQIRSNNISVATGTSPMTAFQLYQANRFRSYSVPSVVGTIDVSSNTFLCRPVSGYSYAYNYWLYAGLNDVANATVRANTVDSTCRNFRTSAFQVPTAPARLAYGTTTVSGNTFIDYPGYASTRFFTVQSGLYYGGSSSLQPRLVVSSNVFRLTIVGMTSPSTGSDSMWSPALYIDPSSARYIDIASNTIELTFASTTRFTPSAMRFVGTIYSRSVVTVSGNTMTLTYSNLTVGVYTTAIAMTSTNGVTTMSNNVANAMLLFNVTTLGSSSGMQATSQCDYLNGQRATVVNNATVLSCSGPAPPLPPLPASGMAVVPTPAPWWIPTPVPTPAPPTLPSSGGIEPDATGSVTKSDFTVTTYTVNAPGTVRLSACTIGTLYFTGTISAADIEVSGCTVTTLMVMSHVETGSSMRFVNGRLGSSSSSRTVYGNFYGYINGSSTVTFTGTTLNGRAGSYQASILRFYAPIETSAAVTFTGVSAVYSVPSSSYDHSGIARIYALGSGGKFTMASSTIRVTGNDESELFAVDETVAGAGSLLNLKSNTITFTTDRDDSSIVHFPTDMSPHLGNINSGGVLNITGNTMTLARSTSYSPVFHGCRRCSVQGAGSKVAVDGNSIVSASNFYGVYADSAWGGGSISFSNNGVNTTQSSASTYGIYIYHSGIIAGGHYAASGNKLRGSSSATVQAVYLGSASLGAGASLNVNSNVMGPLVAGQQMYALLVSLNDATDSSNGVYYASLIGASGNINDNTVATSTGNYVIYLDGGLHNSVLNVQRNAITVSAYTSSSNSMYFTSHAVGRDAVLNIQGNTLQSIAMSRGYYVATMLYFNRRYSSYVPSLLGLGKIVLASNTFTTSVSPGASSASASTRYGVYFEATVANVEVTGNRWTSQVPTGLLPIRLESSAYLSLTNAKYTVTGNNFNSNTYYYVYAMQFATMYYTDITVSNNVITAGDYSSTYAARSYNLLQFSSSLNNCNASVTRNTVKSLDLGATSSSVSSWTGISVGVSVNRGTIDISDNTVTAVMNTRSNTNPVQYVAGISLPYISSTYSHTSHVTAQRNNVTMGGASYWSGIQTVSRSSATNDTITVSSNTITANCPAPAASSSSSSSSGSHAIHENPVAAAASASASASASSSSSLSSSMCSSVNALALTGEMRSGVSLSATSNTIALRNVRGGMGLTVGSVSYGSAVTISDNTGTIIGTSVYNQGLIGVGAYSSVSGGNARVSIQRNRWTFDKAWSCVGTMASSASSTGVIVAVGNAMTATNTQVVAVVNTMDLYSTSATVIRGNTATVTYDANVTDPLSALVAFGRVRSGASVTVSDNVVSASPPMRFVYRVEYYLQTGATFTSRSNSIDATHFIGEYTASSLHLNSTCDRLRGTAFGGNNYTDVKVQSCDGSGSDAAASTVKFEVDPTQMGGAFDPNKFAIELEKELGLPAGSVIVESDSGTGSTTKGEVTVRFSDPAQAEAALAMSPEERSSLGITSMGAAGDEPAKSSAGGTTIGIAIGVVVGLLVVGGIVAFIVMNKAKGGSSGDAARTGMNNGDTFAEQPMLQAQSPPPPYNPAGQPPAPLGQAPQGQYAQPRQQDGLDEFL